MWGLEGVATVLRGLLLFVCAQLAVACGLQHRLRPNHEFEDDTGEVVRGLHIARILCSNFVFENVRSYRLFRDRQLVHLPSNYLLDEVNAQPFDKLNEPSKELSI